MTAPVLADELGPKARRRVLIASIVSGAVILGFVYLGYRRLDQNGQLDAEKWKPFTDWRILKFFLGGLGNTVKAAAAGMGLALVMGGMLALGRLSRTRLARWPAIAYIEFFRALPLYVLIVFTGLGLPQIDIKLGPFRSLVVALAIYNSAVLAEVFRAGILSLDRGQSEAAYAIGLGYWQAMGLVIVPQAVRRMVPAIVSQLVTLLKDTSLGFLIFYEELLRRARINIDFSRNTLPSLVLVAVIYIAVNSTLSFVATRLERRQRRRYGAGRIEVKGADDLAVTGVAAAPMEATA